MLDAKVFKKIKINFYLSVKAGRGGKKREKAAVKRAREPTDEN